MKFPKTVEVEQMWNPVKPVIHCNISHFIPCILHKIEQLTSFVILFDETGEHKYPHSKTLVVTLEIRWFTPRRSSQFSKESLCYAMYTRPGECLLFIYFNIKSLTLHMMYFSCLLVLMNSKNVSNFSLQFFIFVCNHDKFKISL